jgi:hypothetical protein
MSEIPIRVLVYEAIRAVACLGICALGIYSMYITTGETGVGWAILGVVTIYFPTIIFPGFEDDDEETKE